MAHCVNRSHPEFLKLVDSTNINPIILASKVSVWQEKNGLDKFPTITELNIIKPGVEELFESDSNLANQVYEALGFKSKPDVILPIGTSGSGKSTFIKSLPQENLVVIEPDAMRVEFTGDINNKSKDKEIYEEAAKRAVKAIKQGKQVVFDTTNLTKDKRLPFIEAIKKALPNANIQYKLMELNPELAKQRIKAQIARGENRANVSDSTIDRHAESYKQMLEDIKSEPIGNFEITPQQKQQALQLYSQYLDTIFPDSEVKDIVYHGSPKAKIIFEENKFNEKSLWDDIHESYGIYFSETLDLPNSWKEGLYKDTDLTHSGILAVVLNLKNPKYYIDTDSITNFDDIKVKKLKEEGFDSAYTDLLDETEYANKPIITKKNYKVEIVAFESEQIHILGNKQDIENFAKFVNNSNIGNVEAMQNYMNSKSLDFIMNKLIDSGKIKKEC
jgi:predicted kinase